jgi:outer membrane receptor for ferrienterochelin and colicin
MGLSCALAAVAGATSAARADDDRELERMSLEELLTVEVVTASATPRSVADAPSTVYVFTEETIRRRGYRSLPDLLADVPELQIQLGAVPDLGELVTVRGITGSGTEKLLILYDGVRVDGAGNTPVAIGRNFSLANVEQVEVVLGPVSAVYGPDAFTAVVNVRTRGGADLDGGRVSMGWGRFDTGDATVVAGFEHEGVAVAVTAAVHGSDEPDLSRYYPRDFAWYRDRYATDGEVLAFPGAPPDQVVTVPIQPWSTPTVDRFLSARLDAGDFRVVLLEHRHQHSSSLPIRPELALYTDDARWAYRVTSAHVQHDYSSPSRRVMLSTTLSVHSYEVDPRSAFVNVFSSYQPGYKYEQYDTTQLDERINVRVGERLSLAGGLTLETVSGLPKTGDLSKPFDPDSPAATQGHLYPGSDLQAADGRELGVAQDFLNIRERSAGGYVEAVLRPRSDVTLTVGGRTDVHSRYGTSVTPRIGVVVNRGERTRAKLLYGEAFLAPSPNQAFQHHGSFVPVRDGAGDITGLSSFFFRLPNPDLTPERIRMGEALVFHRAGDVQLSGSAFVADVRDRFGSGFLTDVDFKGWPVESVLVPINLDERVLTYGGTAAAQGRARAGRWVLAPAAAWSITGGERGDDPLPATSTHLVKALVDVERGPFSASARMQLRSAARHPETRDAGGALVEIPGSTVFDLHLRWDGVLRDVRARTSLWVDVKNVLDARYHHVSSAFDHLPGVPQDPLRLMVGIDAEL